MTKCVCHMSFLCDRICINFAILNFKIFYWATWYIVETFICAWDMCWQSLNHILKIRSLKIDKICLSYVIFVWHKLHQFCNSKFWNILLGNFIYCENLYLCMRYLLTKFEPYPWNTFFKNCQNVCHMPFLCQRICINFSILNLKIFYWAAWYIVKTFICAWDMCWQSLNHILKILSLKIDKMSLSYVIFVWHKMHQFCNSKF